MISIKKEEVHNTESIVIKKDISKKIEILKIKIEKITKDIQILNQTIISIKSQVVSIDSKKSLRKLSVYEKTIIKSIHQKIVKLLRKKIIVRKSINEILNDTRINVEHKEINEKKIIEHKKILINISQEIFHLKKTIRHIEESLKVSITSETNSKFVKNIVKKYSKELLMIKKNIKSLKSTEYKKIKEIKNKSSENTVELKKEVKIIKEKIYKLSKK